METLGTTFRAILTSLRIRIQHVVRFAGERAPMVELMATRISRLSGRISRLYDRWKAGTLPRPRPKRARMQRPTNPNRPKVSRAFLWLGTVGGVEARIHRAQLEHQIAQPEFADFLAAAPQVGRMLRPLLHILGAEPMPALLALPPRLRKPRPKKPKPAMEPLVINPHAHVPWGLGATITRRLRKSGFTIAPRIPKISNGF